MKNLCQSYFEIPEIKLFKSLHITSVILLWLMISCSPNEQLDETFNSIATSKSDAQMLTLGSPEILTDDLLVPTGSTIGPGGDLFVAESVTGNIWRINTKTREKSIFADGLPAMNDFIGLGGVMDVVFIGDVAYALTALVDPIFGNENAVTGIYKIEKNGDPEELANIGAFAMANPPTGFDFFVPTGVLYSIEVYKGGLLVADGHHNRIYQVTLEGEISEFKTFGNIVPTGLEVSGNTIYMAEAGPIPHLPEFGKVVSFNSKSSEVTEVAVGARLLVDVEFNRGRTMFALSQGLWEGVSEGSPALPNTGSLVKVNADGSFSTVVDGLNLPTSMEFKGNTAYIVTLAGEVLEIKNVTGPPFGS